MGIRDTWSAYQFDVAALMFGREVEAKLRAGDTISKALGVNLSPRERARLGEFRSLKNYKKGQR